MKKVFKLKAERDFFDVEQDRKILRGEEFEVSEERGKVIMGHQDKLVSIISITDVDEVTPTKELSDINVNDPEILILTPTPELSEEQKADQEATPAPVSKRRYTPRKPKK
ncbi:hypothetical protein [Flavobacterium kingsejongi]|uniref:Uncharacterized protein n=1 Tax=Flavobacterium kingsejongi TaxID=1678728 RepID=A0A2S1LQH5_9FLAO|nr:hypothetical protein [Flavobacterium kingsejongi]AWG26010.1 hypothetical protein FK004_12640 [Flavobacterium kingsejongi]